MALPPCEGTKDPATSLGAAESALGSWVLRRLISLRQTHIYQAHRDWCLYTYPDANLLISNKKCYSSGVDVCLGKTESLPVGKQHEKSNYYQKCWISNL